MDTEFPAKWVEQSFEISYQSGSIYNRDLAKRGTLTVRPGEYVFRGRTRGIFFSGRETELILRAEDIMNVARSGKCVQFSTPVGKSGQKKQPFVFFCASELEADTVADLLPDAKDASVVAAMAFHDKLQTMPGSTGAGSVTNLIVAANVVVFVIMGLLGAGWLETASMQPYFAFAANNGAATTDGEWWRLVTAMFAHYGILHLALNMWALFQVGHLVERLLGRPLYTLMYFGSGIIGGLATIVWHGDKVWSAGASGAIFGVYGALLGYLWREKHGIPRSVVQPMMKSTLTFAGYNLIYGAIHPHIDNTAHIGGLTGGLLLGWICALPLDQETRKRDWLRRFGIAAAVTAALIAVGVAVAPRFKYRFRDELAWENAIETRSHQEQTLLDAGGRVFTDAEKNGTTAAIAWMRNEAIPFYEKWRSDLGALALAPQRVTAKRRDALVHIFDLKLKSYRDFADGLATGDKTAAGKFSADQREIAAALQALQATN
jgi:rhomboid protease GluP